MYGFIDGIINFISSILTNIVLSFGSKSQTLANQYNTFLTSQIFDGTLISSPLTWYQFFQFLVPILLIALAIYLFIKFAFKLLSLFSLR